MLQKLTAIVQATKPLRRSSAPEFFFRARTLLRNKMRLRKTPDDPVLQGQIERNIADTEAEIAKRAH